MTILFNDNLIGSGDLSGRVSTSGHVWTAYTDGEGATESTGMLTLSSDGCYNPVGSTAHRSARANDVTLPNDAFTFGGVIKGSSATSSIGSWQARFGAFNGVNVVFAVGLVMVNPTVYIREYSVGSTFNSTLHSFSRVASAVYDLRVEFSGGAYTVFLDGVAVAGPITPVVAPVNAKPYMVLTNSASGSTQRAFIQSTEFSSSVPPVFWTALIGAAETI